MKSSTVANEAKIVESEEQTTERADHQQLETSVESQSLMLATHHQLVAVHYPPIHLENYIPGVPSIHRELAFWLFVYYEHDIPTH